MKKLVVGLLCLSVFIFAVGCGVSKGALADAEQRIETLKEKGVPDSSLSRAIVFLYQAKDAKERGNTGLAKMSGDSMLVLIAQAEENYSKDMERLKPLIESKKADYTKNREELSGMQLRKLDSMVALVDSFATINWLLQAEAQTNAIDTLLPRLKFDEETAAGLIKRVPGKWVCTQRTTHKEDKTVNATETKIFTFNRNGTGSLLEKKQGKSSPYLKEDWEFRSTGTWGLMGDTIMLKVDRFKVVRQNFHELHKKNGKKFWTLDKKPTYDSAITDGSQDRYITYADLKLDFNRK